MARIAQFARFTAHSGHGPKVVEALQNALGSARTEPGTQVYAIHQEVGNPDVVWMYELYSDTDAQAAHSGSPATSTLRAAVADLLAEPLTVSRCVVGHEFGLPVE
jgi:(4S)-4-hydroxy-5-phosphonooxypentane-2,3-dione isomerase